MKVILPEICDLIPHSSPIPVNCVVFLTPKEIAAGAKTFTVSHSGGDFSQKTSYSLTPFNQLGYAIDLPYIPFSPKSTIKIDSYGDNGEIESFEKEIRSVNESQIPLATELTQDSIYVRSLPDSTLVSFDTLPENTRNRLSFCSNPLTLQIKQALNYLDAFSDYLDTFDMSTQTIIDGCSKIFSILDSMDNMKTNPHSAGIVFMAIMSRLGLDPVILFSGKRCFAGLSMPTGHFIQGSKTITLSFKTGYPIKKIHQSKCLLIEISKSQSFSERLDSAYEYCRSVEKWDGMCKFSAMKEKIETINKLNCKPVVVKDEY